MGTARDKALPPDMLFEVMATRLLQSKNKDDREYFRAAAEDKHTQVLKSSRKISRYK